MSEPSDKRERLVNAAASLFWTRGYSATSLAVIAKESGVPLGNIYYYFRTKADFALAVAALFQNATHDALASIEAQHTLIEEQLSAFFELLAGSAQERKELGCPIARHICDVRHDAPEASLNASQVFHTMEAWIFDRLIASGVEENKATRFSKDVLIRWQGSIILAQAKRDVSLIHNQLLYLKNEAAHLISEGKGSSSPVQT